MCTLALLLSVDPFLGRMEYSSFSDQALIEMLIKGFDDKTKNKYKDNDDMYLDVCNWSLIRCNADERVIRIQIDCRNVNGSLELCYVPPNVRVFIIASWGKNQLRGSDDLTHLPDGMTYLSLGVNQFTRDIALKSPLSGMKDLRLNHNQLTGDADLTNLPDGMRYLALNNNHLTGEIDLGQLPD